MHNERMKRKKKGKVNPTLFIENEDKCIKL